MEEVNLKERQRAEKFLQTQRISLHQIKSFSFMKRYRQAGHNDTSEARHKYGPGILTLHLKEGKDKIICLQPFRRPSSIIRFLIAEGLTFENYAPQERNIGKIATTTYRRSSLYMLWFLALWLVFLVLGGYALSSQMTWTLIPGILSLGLSFFFMSMLMTRFCYLTLHNNTLTIRSIGRTIRYPYADLRKVNFDFAREQTFTHVMELLDKNYRYRLFYIGRVSRKALKEITTKLQQAGIDATCSLNVEKRFFQDIHR